MAEKEPARYVKPAEQDAEMGYYVPILGCSTGSPTTAALKIRADCGGGKHSGPYMPEEEMFRVCQILSTPKVLDTYLSF
jgi:hypothetical protein